MGWESCDLVRFDLEPLLQGQMRAAKPKVLINRLCLVLVVCSVKQTYRKSWCNLGLTFDLAIVTLTFKIMLRLHLETRKV